MQCEWDPEDKSLVFDFKLTGKPAPNHTHVVYKRGTNSNDFLNRPLEEVNILKQTLLAELILNGIIDKLQGIASTAMQQPTRSDQDQITGMQTSAQQPLMSLFGITRHI
ncbi:hypothetical protein WJX77_005618 [Trebouxia sp. C0004]